MLRMQLENIALQKGNERALAIQQLASLLAINLQDNLSELEQFLGSPLKNLRVVAVEIIRAIGYPQNAHALPIMLDEFTDPNSPALYEVVHMLDDLEVKVANMYLLQLLGKYAYNGNALAYSEVLECVCSWLVLRETKHVYAETVGPLLIATIDLWSNDTYCRDSVLGTLESIGMSITNYALPGLLEVAWREKGSIWGRRVWIFINSLDPGFLVLYQLILNEIQQYYPEKS
jgi:hypothetical protein